MRKRKKRKKPAGTVWSEATSRIIGVQGHRQAVAAESLARPLPASGEGAKRLFARLRYAPPGEPAQPPAGPPSGQTLSTPFPSGNNLSTFARTKHSAFPRTPTDYFESLTIRRLKILNTPRWLCVP
jgi:hypothetical protein